MGTLLGPATPMRWRPARPPGASPHAAAAHGQAAEEGHGGEPHGGEPHGGMTPEVAHRFRTLRTGFLVLSGSLPPDRWPIGAGTLAGC
jgi:hypothetical protein